MSSNLECDKECALLKEFYRLVEEDERSLSQLSLHLQVPQNWLTKTMRRETSSPSVNRIAYVVEKLLADKSGS